MRLKARTDGNHTAIVDAFRAMGASVLDLSRMGRGCPDLLLGWHGRCFLVEVKDGKLSASRRKLTPDQVDFHAYWRGQLAIVTSVDEAIELLKGAGHAHSA